MNIETIRILNVIKNGSLVNLENVITDSNKLSQKILSFLYKEGLILSYRLRRKANYYNNTSEILVQLRHYFGKPILRKLKVMSFPSKTMCISYKSICRISAKNKIFVFSTTKGLLTLDECKRFRVGGILLFVC
jgi:ribosomal protein S8